MLPATATAPLPALDLRLGAKKFVPETKESEREREGGDCKEEVGAFHQNFCPQRSGTTKRERRKAEAKVSGRLGRKEKARTGRDCLIRVVNAG